MTLTLSATDLNNLREAIAAFASPFASESAVAWRSRCVNALQSLTGGDRAAFILPMPGEPLTVQSPELDAAAHAWASYYHQLDLSRTPRGTEMEAFHFLDVWEPSTLSRSEFYIDWALPHRVDNALAMVIDVPASSVRASAHAYSESADPTFAARGPALLKLVYPAFRAGTELLLRHRAARGRLVASFDVAPDGVLLADVDARVLHLTPRLLAMLSADPERETLRAAILASARAAAAMHRGRIPSDAPRPDALHQTVRTASDRYTVRAMLLDGQLGNEGPLVVVTVATPSHALADHDLAERFGLTAREISVARQLAVGRTAREIASALGVTIHTARRHTEHVLQKLGLSTRAAVGSRLSGA